MPGKPKEPEKEYNPAWGGSGRGQGPHRKKRVLSSGQAETFHVYQPNSDKPLLVAWGGIEIDGKTGIATITTPDGWKLVIGAKLQKARQDG